MEILIEKINVLEDGKVKISLSNNSIDWLQPVIIVDSYPTNENFSLKGSEGREGRVSVDSIEEIDGVAFSGTYEQLETALREAAKTANGLRVGGASGGGGGSATSTDTLQQEQIDQQAVKQEAFYFNFSDIEEDSLSFPVTCTITAGNSSGSAESIASATYNTIDELITAFNSGINYYAIEKRTNTSFYVLAGTVPIERDNLTDFVQFRTGINPSRTYRFYRLNIGSYPASNLSASDLLLEEARANNGTGRGEEMELVNPSDVVFYNVKSISVIAKVAADGDIEIKELTGTTLTTAAIDIPYTTAKGNSVEQFTKNYPRVSKNPIVINNTGDAGNTVVVSVIY